MCICDYLLEAVLELNVKFSLSLIKYHIIKTYDRVKAQLQAFLTSALFRGEWPAHVPAALPPKKARALDKPNTKLGSGGEEKRLCPRRKSNFDPIDLQAVVWSQYSNRHYSSCLRTNVTLLKF